MAGASNTEIQDAFIVEVTSGTTPATPSFTKSSFDTLTMTADPRISESFPRAAFGQRLGIGRNGIAVAGSAAGKMIYGEYDDFFSSLFQADWSTDVLVNGQSQISMSIEQAVPQGAGGAFGYTRFRGVEASTGQIALTAGSDATVSLDLIGSGSDDASASIISGATYAAATESDIIGSGADIGTIVMAGYTLDCMESLTVDFGISDKDEQPRISSDDSCGISRGVMRPELTGRFYMEANFIDMYNAARSTHTDFAVTVPIGSVTLKKYELYFPKCQFVGNPIETGESGPAFQTFRILPKYDSGIGGTSRLTRAVA